jgi:hypothetical protein
LDGYKAAMSHVNAKLMGGCVNEMKKIQSRVVSNPRAAIPDDVTQSWNLCVLAGSFDFGFEQRELRNGVDEFYKDTQNSNVSIDVALQHVRDVLESKRPKNGSGIGGPQGQTHQWFSIGEIRWDEKAGLRRDAVRSQVIDVLKAQEIKETGNEEG